MGRLIMSFPLSSMHVGETVTKDITFSHGLRSMTPCQKSNANEQDTSLSLWGTLPEMKSASKLNLMQYFKLP